MIKKLKIEIQYDPTIPLLSIYTEKMKTVCRRTCTCMSKNMHFPVHHIIIHNNQDTETSYVSANGRLYKENVIHYSLCLFTALLSGVSVTPSHPCSKNRWVKYNKIFI